MSRVPLDLISFGLPSAIIASMALALGTLLGPASGPAIAPGPVMRAAFVDAGTCLSLQMAPFAAPGASGSATVCDDGQDVRIALQAIGLPGGEQHTAWLTYRFAPRSCRDAVCRPTEPDSGSPDGAMQQIGQAVVQPSGDVLLNSRVRDLRLVHGAEITLQLQGELGRAGPYLQAVIMVP